MTNHRPYPYIAPGRTIGYVPDDNLFLQRAAALTMAMRARYPRAVITGAVLVKEGAIIGAGTNHPIHHSFCPRTAFSFPSGEGYELCPRHCHSQNHAERTAIRNTQEQNRGTNGADLYLYGHWWLCKPCWDEIIAAGIRDVYLAKDATEKFYQNISFKGEPERSVRVRVDGTTPKSEIKTLLARVGVELVEDTQSAEFVFYPPPNPSPEEFVSSLSAALETAGIYEIADMQRKVIPPIHSHNADNRP